MSDIDTDPITSALSTRRIPHSRTQPKGRDKGKGNSSRNKSVFDPLRTLGYYEVHLGSRAKRAKKHESSRGETSSWLEIHQLTDGEDGLVGTFVFDLQDGEKPGTLEGMCILAGSRKGLLGIVEALEREGNEADEEENDDDDDDDDDDDGSADEESGEDNNANNSLEDSDARLNRRHAAFEKNTFRNPKFWFRWKGGVHDRSIHQHSPQADPADGTDKTGQAHARNSESDSGYIVFANNACDKFEGTVSCSTLGWDNLKMTGWKTRSKGTPCPTNWMDM